MGGDYGDSLLNFCLPAMGGAGEAAEFSKLSP